MTTRPAANAIDWLSVTVDGANYRIIAFGSVQAEDLLASR
jgi:hypothetical protein